MSLRGAWLGLWGEDVVISSSMPLSLQRGCDVVDDHMVVRVACYLGCTFAPGIATLSLAMTQWWV